MALYTRDHDAPRIVAAAKHWVERALINDGSVFCDETIGTRESYDALYRYFVQRPDEGSDSFYEKLDSQLTDAPPDARKLMAELIWAFFLFPSNISEPTKRSGVVRVWNLSGDQLDPTHPLLADDILGGVGSGGMGVNIGRWRELNYMVALGQALKALSTQDRRITLGDYDSFLTWIDKFSDQGDRQFRHMLRYMLFPERVERMSSNRDRRRVLAAFGVASMRDTVRWTDRNFDDAMLTLRREWEGKLETPEIDFYIDPLRSRWMAENESDDASPADDAVTDGSLETDTTPQRPARNTIYYGPPGTGKTRRMQRLFKDYTEQTTDLDRDAWLQQLVAPHGWRAVIAVALAGAGQGSKVDAIEAHELIAAKARQRKTNQHVRSTIWNTLQGHTSKACVHVNVADKRPPYLFEKDESSRWSLLSDWSSADGDAAELYASWRAGQQNAAKVRRYRVVTFHPSYSYEDFVNGLRPVAFGDGEGTTSFRMVDGVFKQICAEARANPSRRYALFIDEINRAQIAKVFGELITLVEPDKRARYDAAGQLVTGMEVQLPGTGGDEGEDERFGVPENLDLIATMNSADRSIAQLDIALRRRFEFIEMPPEYDMLQQKVEGIDLAALLRRINDRIEYLAGRDRLIGHGYLTRVTTLGELRTVFRDQLIPLLYEYFFDDPARVELVLSDHLGRSPFIERQRISSADLFAPKAEVEAYDRARFRVTPEAAWSPAAFRGIYESQATSSS